jgi:hypothetical protein
MPEAAHGNSREPVKVRQRQFAIGLRGTNSSALETDNILPCTGLVGIDAQAGVVFLFHLDPCVCRSPIGPAIDELKSHVNDLKAFQLYTFSSFSPLGIGFISLALTLIFHLINLISHWFELSWLGAVICFFLSALGFSFTRLCLWYQLRNLKEIDSKVVSLASSGCGIYGRIRVDANTGLAPKVDRHWCPNSPDDFNVPKDIGCKLTRAEGSALPSDQSSKE